ncbi:MAG: PD40 domain-containing protein [Fimbriimonas ginsengisoli]|nr:PD40 domain-containing protein [Fimbriimonas ginsengisoli]
MFLGGAVGIALAAAGVTLRAENTGHKLTAMDEFNLQAPADPQISPDGKKIVYVRRFNDPMTDRRYSNLWIINADGSEHRALTTGNRSDGSPRWSPDERMVRAA